MLFSDSDHPQVSFIAICSSSCVILSIKSTFSGDSLTSSGISSITSATSLYFVLKDSGTISVIVLCVSIHCGVTVHTLDGHDCGATITCCHCSSHCSSGHSDTGTIHLSSTSFICGVSFITSCSSFASFAVKLPLATLFILSSINSCTCTHFFPAIQVMLENLLRNDTMFLGFTIAYIAIPIGIAVNTAGVHVTIANHTALIQPTHNQACMNHAACLVLAFSIAS